MRTRPGPFYIQELARAIARLPGRAEVDEQEAYRTTDDIAQWHLRGEFSDDEVVAYAGDPPGLQSLAEIKEEARRRGETWCLSQPEWRAAYWLTAPAAFRYLKGCGLAGAPRVLREWFARAHRVKPTPKELDEWMRLHVRRGVKRDDAIQACCNETGATVRAAKEAWARLPDELKLRRGDGRGWTKSSIEIGRVRYRCSMFYLDRARQPVISGWSIANLDGPGHVSYLLGLVYRIAWHDLAHADALCNERSRGAPFSLSRPIVSAD